MTGIRGSAVGQSQVGQAPRYDYESDLVAWSERQASLARARKAHMLDLSNLAEELEEMGRKERRALES